MITFYLAEKEGCSQMQGNDPEVWLLECTLLSVPYHLHKSGECKHPGLMVEQAK
jgi:hypothetical protein